jgi:hypothetical protein
MGNLYSEIPAYRQAGTFRIPKLIRRGVKVLEVQSSKFKVQSSKFKKGGNNHTLTDQSSKQLTLN